MNPQNQNQNQNQNPNPTLPLIIPKSPHYPTTGGPATSSSSGQACAACKYQRRKCAADCPLSPYFPPTKTKDFLNTHRLFGVSNIVKTIKSQPPAYREPAVNSMISQANARARDPVGGCLGIIRDYQKQIVQAEAEYELVRRQLDYLRVLHQDNIVPGGARNPNFQFDGGGGGGVGIIDSSIRSHDNDYKNGLKGVNVEARGSMKFGVEGNLCSDSSKGKAPLEDVKPLHRTKSNESTISRENVVLKRKENIVQTQPPKKQPKEEDKDLKGASPLFQH